jgi:hypothetical protein
MTEPIEQQMLQVLREIRSGQREVLQALAEHRALVQEQMQTSRSAVAESVQLQRVGLARQRTISLVCRRGHTGLLRSDRVSGVEVFMTTNARIEQHPNKSARRRTVKM